MNKSMSFDPVALEYDFAAEIVNNNDFFLSRMSKAKTSVLDVGCGSGILAYALSDHYDRVYGIDISEGMLEIARSKRHKPSIQYMQMNAEEMMFDQTFDLIVSRTTLHHIEDKESLFEKMKYLLKDDGKIVLIDNVSKVPTPKRYLNVIGAHLEFVGNIKSYGFKTARRLYKHGLSKDWLDHLDHDVYLSQEEATQLYHRHFPGCQLTRFACFLGMEWQKDKKYE